MNEAKLQTIINHKDIVIELLSDKVEKLKARCAMLEKDNEQLYSKIPAQPFP